MSQSAAGSGFGGPSADLLHRQPWGTMIGLGGAGLALALVNHALHGAGFELDTPDPWFPISVFWARFHASGGPGLLLFGLLLALAVWRGRHCSRLGLWALGLGLVLSANLIQGSLGAAFVEPFTEEHPGFSQYYHDAVVITDDAAWLRGFNHQQPQLPLHTRTHPPFAVLIHRPGLALGGVAGLVISFLLAASLTLPLFASVLAQLGVTAQRRALLVLLLAVVPAFNIYAAVSLDAVVAAAATLFLAGLIRSLSRGADAVAVGAMSTGFLLTNALTFAGVYQLPVLVAAAWWRWRQHRRADLAVAAGGVMLAGLGAISVLAAACGYHHIEAFLTASRLENPGGYLAFTAPLGFVMTRIEGVCEIALFLSLPVLATLLQRARGAAAPQPAARTALLAAAVTLAAMLLAGAFRTGETARACLFLVPYLLLPLSALDETRLRDLIALAGLQTAAMQLVGDFFW